MDRLKKLENISIGTTQKAITIVGLKSLEFPRR